MTGVATGRTGATGAGWTGSGCTAPGFRLGVSGVPGMALPDRSAASDTKTTKFRVSVMAAYVYFRAEA